jgi:hypothetical protein
MPFYLPLGIEPNDNPLLDPLPWVDKMKSQAGLYHVSYLS